MSTLQTLNNNESGLIARGKINDNLTALNTDKLESTDLKTVNGNSLVGSGDIVISGGGSVATDTIWDAKGDLAVGTGANTASRLAVGANGTIPIADSAEETGIRWGTPAGGGDALTSGTLAQFASTTSAQLAGVISDETGSGGVLVFSNSPALTTPSIAAITVSGGVLTLPTGASDTLVGKATTDTLTNKTLTSPVINTPTGIVKGDVGLGNVDNTSDATKNSASATLTNKNLISSTNVIEEITTTASSATPTPTGGSLKNFFTVTALAAGATFGAPSGTPVNGNTIIMRVKDNGTARTLAYNAIYRAIGVTLPTTTVISKTLYFGMKYNSTDSKWDIIAYGIEP